MKAYKPIQGSQPPTVRKRKLKAAISPQKPVKKKRHKSQVLAPLRFLEQAGVKELGIGILKHFTKAELDLIDFMFANYRKVLEKGITWLLKQTGHQPRLLYEMVQKPQWTQLIMFKVQGTALIYAPVAFEDMCKEAISSGNTVLVKNVLNQAGILNRDNPLVQVNIANLRGGSDPKQVEDGVKERLKVIDMNVKKIDDRITALPSARGETRAS